MPGLAERLRSEVSLEAKNYRVDVVAPENRNAVWQAAAVIASSPVRNKRFDIPKLIGVYST